MRQVIFTSEDRDTIDFGNIDAQRPIFAKKGGRLSGMIVEETDQGWILRIGGRHGATGYHSSLRECMKSCIEFGFTFHVNSLID